MQLKLLYKTLDDARHQNGEEFWYARDLWQLFGYGSWRNFQPAIEKAKESCKTTGEPVDTHFVDIHKMVKIGQNQAEREIDDIKLTRFACYLIAQNGDPRIPEIAFSQMYFATQTRKQEVMEKHIEEIERLVSRKKLLETEKEFSKTLYERGVDGAGIGEVRSAGDKVLFGGKSTQEMKERLGLGHNSPKALADVLPTITLKAKDLASEMTTVNTKKNNLVGKHPIKAEHIKNNTGIRSALEKSNILPETLPASEDIKKVESRHQKQKKELQSINKKQLSE
jgi:DNA-damage-inducible protein D